MRSSPYSSLSPRDLFIVLNAIPCLGNRKVLAITSSPEALEALDHLSPDDLAHAFGVSSQAARNISHFPAEDFLKKETDAVREKGFSLVTWADAEYPQRLREIPDPPVVLYFSGELPGGWERSLAIVGSRNPTLYGLEMARRFGRELAEAGFIVVSGLARGIDRAAHEGCLEGGRPTIAVLGCGLDVNYPRDHAGLFREISSRGCVISEFPLGTEPAPYNFPRRNRIVSGLSLGAFVIEARQKSGALITADFALEQGREVFALPGRIDSPLSEGPIRLIRSGAKPVLSIEDILEEMPPGQEKSAPAPEILEPDGGVMDKDQSRVLEILACGEASFDEMIARSGRRPSELSRVLLSLQMRGRINEAPGKVYSLVARKKGEEKRKVFA